MTTETLAWRTRNLLLAAAAVILVAAGVAALPAPEAAAAGPQALVDGHGIHVVSSTWLDARLLDVTVSTDALAMPVHVRVLVPTGYNEHPATKYPSMYLLHGCAAGHPSSGLEYTEFTAADHAEQATAGVGAIVVMPEGGGGGFYTDWFNGGKGGPPKWETFHITQLVPWIDQNFRTIQDRSQRAIAGLSMGGFGSLSYAARHPDLFGSAASFSGAADLTNPADEAEPIATVVVDTCAAADGGAPGSTFGSHVTDELNWRAHDPARLVENLRNTQMYLYTGNGDAGPLDPPGPPSAAAGGIEVLAHRSTLGFEAQLVAAGIPHFFDDYGPGTHSEAYFERDFRDVLPRFVADFAANRHPSMFTFKTALASYDVYGWHVGMQRNADEFSTLANAGSDGFMLSGSGSASVTTAAIYKPSTSYKVRITSASGVTTSTVTSDGSGRLRLEVPLGPANPYQQFTALGACSKTYTTAVAVGTGTQPPATPIPPTVDDACTRPPTVPPVTGPPATSAPTPGNPSRAPGQSTNGTSPAQAMPARPTFTG